MYRFNYFILGVFNFNDFIMNSQQKYYEHLNKIDPEEYKRMIEGDFSLKVRKPVLILDSNSEPIVQINTNWMNDENN